jgi:hypothetical protein
MGREYGSLIWRECASSRRETRKGIYRILGTREIRRPVQPNSTTVTTGLDPLVQLRVQLAGKLATKMPTLRQTER